MTYNTLIDVYGKLGQWEQALQVLRRMKYQVCSKPPPSCSFSPSLHVPPFFQVLCKEA